MTPIPDTATDHSITGLNPPRCICGFIGTGESMAIHMDEWRRTVDEAIATAEKALADRFSDVIPVTTRGGYMVASASQSGAWWLLQVHHEKTGIRVECPCPAGARISEGFTDNMCRHMKRLLAYTEAEEARLRRPSAPPAISALVD